MSSISIATLPRMGRDALAALLSTGEPSNLAIVDVRDSDHVGGHIRSSTWVPSSTLDVRMPELIRTLKDKKMVVFHCALSQQRGPSAALRYARERESALGQDQPQQVFVLEGGFVEWQQKYGNDAKLTEAFAADIWEEY
ncbi:hypothetical protein N7541_008987 [Penicillium brevicompactum]|uniref:Rhodanese domain-containing protein n=1 Tax=Penicillium brevicompactum TaxID=5074 RepID=A0A9W9QVK7_PENBR|nr:hypothetical protein N7541_008987 [Penicillium brevicompactum]